MKVIVMSKKGCGTIKMEQNDNGYFYTRDGITMKMADATELNNAYTALKKAGWIVKDPKETEKKAAAPKERKQAAPRFKWGKEGRKVWAIQAQIYKDYLRVIMANELKTLKGREYHDRLDNAVKAEMKVFESRMADIVNANI